MRILVPVLIVAGPLQIATGEYSRMMRLETGDPVFETQQVLVRDYYVRASAGEELPELEIYRYHPLPGDTLFGIAARLSVPYSAVATLNRLESSSLSGYGDVLLLPSIPGVFVPLTPESDLEQIMHELRRDHAAIVLPVETASGQIMFRFLPGSDFLPEERSTFLGVLFRPPLRTMEISSGFGPRAHPVTGEWAFHAGIDIPSPEGSPVLAARAGSVAATGRDPEMGNYVLLKHSGGFTTFYGHLDTVAVSLNDRVRSGMIVGTVGSTGTTTGSHLHFEIRQNNDPRDPVKLLP